VPGWVADERARAVRDAAFLEGALQNPALLPELVHALLGDDELWICLDQTRVAACLLVPGEHLLPHARGTLREGNPLHRPERLRREEDDRLVHALSISPGRCGQARRGWLRRASPICA